MALLLQATHFTRNPGAAPGAIAGNETPVAGGAIARGEGRRKLVESIQFDLDGVFAKAAHHVLPHEGDGGYRHRDNGQQYRCEQAMADG